MKYQTEKIKNTKEKDAETKRKYPKHRVSYRKVRLRERRDDSVEVVKSKMDQNGLKLKPRDEISVLK